MQFSTIASGSSGNCLFAGNDDTHILIDTGISKKRIEEGLRSFGVESKDIQCIFVTHEHSDHISGLGVWSRKYHIPIYGTYGTLREIQKTRSLGEIDPELFVVIQPDQPIKIGNITVTPFSMPHDAADPVSYRIEDGRYAIGTATDLGYPTEKVQEHLKACDLLYIEANHDLRMLETGPYPYSLKRRIMGNYGHLCNEVSGQLIGSVLEEKTRHIILGHLSKENNFPELAQAAVRNELNRDFAFDDRVKIEVAPRSQSMHLITL